MVYTGLLYLSGVRSFSFLPFFPFFPFWKPEIELTVMSTYLQMEELYSTVDSSNYGVTLAVPCMPTLSSATSDKL